MEVKDLNPKRVFEIFDQITKVPRPSKKEERIRQFLLDFAKQHGLETKVDKIGNVAIFKAATPGHENAPRVILQGHMDMVCESNDKSFDFDNTPISAVVDGEWVRAEGTTLGADNGIGVAASLAALTEPNLVHGPIEALFTVDEETGMTGAFGIEKEMLDGDMLVNLDSEDDAQIFVGCAGGVDTVCTFHYNRSFAPKDFIYFKIDIAKGLGGHSGGDIHLGRANANKLLARFLFDISRKHEISLSEFDGGNLRNAIPRAAHAIIGVHTTHKESVRVELNKFIADIQNEYADIEPTLEITMESVDTPDFCIDSASTTAIIRSIYSAPHGVVSMSRDIEGLVETSTNLASVPAPTDLTDWCLVFFGDSIIGNYTDSTSIPNMTASLSGCEAYNLGIGGTSACVEGSDPYPFPVIVEKFCGQETLTLPEKVICPQEMAAYYEREHDGKQMCFVVNYGLNDYFGGVLIENPEDPFDLDTYTGALRSGIRDLRAAFPESVIVLAAPGYVDLFSQGQGIQSDVGGVLTDYVEAAGRVAQETNAIFMNNYYDLGVDASNSAVYLVDRCHLGDNGRFLYAQALIRLIQGEMDAKRQ